MRVDDTCASCGADLVWATTAAGKSMPLDAAPVGNGNVELDGNTARVRGPGYTWPAGADRYLSHFATCPEAAKHRRGR